MLIRILRLHLAHEPGRSSGWLAGLADPTVADALREMHARPGHSWTVAELARTAAVSRSTLAARFKDVVGKGPLEYLTEWRIELAAEGALSVAFKRTTGLSPRAYREQLTRSG
nr:AraC family transcriptional regulator [Micromonospora kangleipakensis]